MGDMAQEGCFHYTSRYHAQAIISQGKIDVGRSGFIWLSPDDYKTGTEASDRLGIVGKAVEVRVVLPISRINGALSGSRVKPVFEGSKFLRKGLGKEFRVTKPIDISGLAWQELGWP